MNDRLHASVEVCILIGESRSEELVVDNACITVYGICRFMSSFMKEVIAAIVAMSQLA
jgi:hypothetical protein